MKKIFKVVTILCSVFVVFFIASTKVSATSDCITSKSQYEKYINSCEKSNCGTGSGSCSSYALCTAIGQGIYTKKSIVESMVMKNPEPLYYIKSMSDKERKDYRNYCKTVKEKCVSQTNAKVAVEKWKDILGSNSSAAKCVTSDTTDKNAEQIYQDCLDRVNKINVKQEWNSNYSNWTCKTLLDNKNIAGAQAEEARKKCQEEKNTCDTNHEVQKEHINNNIGTQTQNFWEQLFNTEVEYICGGLSERFVELMGKIYKTLTVGGVVAVIILGALDFFKAVSSDDDSAMKKAWSKFIKRLIAAILLAILPALLQFLFSVLGVEEMKTCLDHF